MSQTADRYAKAFFELAREENCLEPVQNSLTELRDIILAQNDFRLFLCNPLLAYEERHAVLKALFEEKLPELSYRFLLFITFKNRLSILKEIIESFDQLYLASTKHLRAYVTTALPIDEPDKVIFNQRLGEKFKQEMLTKWKLDPSLIGGFRIFIRGNMYDYSFKNQLDHFIQQTT